MSIKAQNESAAIRNFVTDEARRLVDSMGRKFSPSEITQIESSLFGAAIFAVRISAGVVEGKHSEPPHPSPLPASAEREEKTSA